MCGIAGIVRFDEGTADAGMLHRMAEAMAHRGPDGSGVFVDEAVGFAHRRLAIIDLSDHAAQPLEYQDRFVITYNGEVYNYVELRDELRKRDHHFESSGDTEVILAAYAEWGPACVERFNGMWAFLIYDRLEKTVFASRDRFGIKPLYFVRTGEQIVFSSEIKQLLSILQSVRANRCVLADFMVLGLAQHTDQTFFQDIEKFPQAHTMIIRLNGDVTLKRYYRLEVDQEIAQLGVEEAVDQFGEVLSDSVRLRLRSDVRVGSCLSGGLDSSTICAIAAKANPKLIGITAASGEKKNDETSWASIVARECGLDWHTIPAQRSDFEQQMELLAHVQEEPFPTPSIYLQYRVFEKAAELGCKVMLDGQGGDETLLGYERYFASYLLSLTGIARLQGVWNASRRSRLSLPDVIKYAAYFLSPRLRRSVLAARARKHLAASVVELAQWEWIDRLAAWYRDPTKMQVGEISSVQLPNLLMYEDKNSMSHSIESRLPYLDYRLVEYALSVPHEFKIRDGWSKWILRSIADRQLPTEIAWRRDKVGFEAPSARMMQVNRDYIIDKIAASSIWKEWSKTKVVPSDVEAGDVWKWFFVACWEEAYRVSP